MLSKGKASPASDAGSPLCGGANGEGRDGTRRLARRPRQEPRLGVCAAGKKQGQFPDDPLNPQGTAVDRRGG